MRTISVKYPTITIRKSLGDKIYVLETIRNLDEAIDMICSLMTPEEQLDPFAEDLCPYFGILWPASEALSMYLIEKSHIIKEKSVLEIGCGPGLPSLVATSLGGAVLATDFHPDVEEYFLRNCRHSSLKCKYQRMNWRDSKTDLGKYDIVIGSDVLYESKHPEEVAQSLMRFVKPGGKIILSDPGRAYLQNFLDAMNGRGIRENISLFTIENKDIFVLEFSL